MDNWMSQTYTMGRVSGRPGYYLENNATLWHILQAESFQISS
jgi:hypothetical protein